MSEPDFAPLTDLTRRAESGDPAAKDALFAALYEELHRLARAHRHKAFGPLTLSTTTLLHEAYINISRRESLAFPDRKRFLAYASRAMRGLVIDSVRHHHAQKRGGELTFVSLDDAAPAAPRPPDTDLDYPALGRALDALAELEPALAELVDLRFFCDFSVIEIAALRGVSERTVQRDWNKARILLHDSLSES